MEYGLIGEKLGHSFSEIIHGKIGHYKYELKEIKPEDLRDFMLKGDFRGINVTIPYKKAVIPFLQHIDPDAGKIGAVNMVVKRDSELYGYNTDKKGLVMLLKRILGRSGRNDLSGLPVLILGTGGTSLTAAAAASELGAPSVLRVSRTGRNGAATYEDAVKLGNTGFIINCTPCGMFPDTGSIPLHPGVFPGLAGTADVIYNPLRTVFVRESSGLGIPSEGGLFMLVQQAVSAYEKFFSAEAEEGLAEKIYSDIFLSEENAVLIGMPSSGKTTVGKYIAEKTGRKFIDTDLEIVKAEGRPIPEIFRLDGEKYFRSLESKVIEKISREVRGAVIATGGGAVLDACNLDRLKANGRVYWLDRPLEALMPSPGRPLASDAGSIRKCYFERLGLYSSLCDVRIPACTDPGTEGENIIKEFRERNI